MPSLITYELKVTYCKLSGFTEKNSNVGIFSVTNVYLPTQAATWFAYRKNRLPFGNQHQVKFVNEGNKEVGA